MTTELLKQAYHSGKTMLVTYGKLEQVNYSVNAGYYLTTIKRRQPGEVGYALRGRYHFMQPSEVKF